jgi:hypothetical protein
MANKDEYELTIKTNDELESKSYLLHQLEEMEDILKTYGNKASEVRLKKVKVKEK